MWRDAPLARYRRLLAIALGICVLTALAVPVARAAGGESAGTLCSHRRGPGNPLGDCSSQRCVQNSGAGVRRPLACRAAAWRSRWCWNPPLARPLVPSLGPPRQFRKCRNQVEAPRLPSVRPKTPTRRAVQQTTETCGQPSLKQLCGTRDSFPQILKTGLPDALRSQSGRAHCCPPPCISALSCRDSTRYSANEAAELSLARSLEDAPRRGSRSHYVCTVARPSDINRACRCSSPASARVRIVSCRRASAKRYAERVKPRA